MSSPNVLFTNKETRLGDWALRKPVKFLCTDIVGASKLGSEYTTYNYSFLISLIIMAVFNLVKRYIHQEIEIR